MNAVMQQQNSSGTSIAALQQRNTGIAVAEGETASSTVSAQARALVMAHFEMAIRQPRDWDSVRQDLLKECKRPSFANNKSAYYKKPVGDGVEGLGIRFVEVALRCMKNVMVSSQLIYEDADKETHRVTVVDVESNLPYYTEIKVSKTVERSRPLEDGTYVSVRKNSRGKDVYTVPANDDDLLNKRAALISKAIRTLGLRIIPGDLQDEAEDIIKQVRKDNVTKDPDAAKKGIIDAFAELGVKVESLIEYLGHSMDEITSAEILDLRGFYGAIRDGETSWRAVIEDRKAKRAEGKDTAPPPADPKKTETKPAAQAKPTPAEAQGDAASDASERMAATQAAGDKPNTFLMVNRAGLTITELSYTPKIGEEIEAGSNVYRVWEVAFDPVIKKHVARVDVVEKPAPAAAAQSGDDDIELSDVLVSIKQATDAESIAGAEDLSRALKGDDLEIAKNKLAARRAELGLDRPKRGRNIE